MADLADFPVHDVPCPHHIAAERRANRLMPETYAEHRTLTQEVPDQINADARLLRRTRSGRHKSVAGPHGFDPLRGNLIIAAHLDLFPQLAQILDQVVGEGIVIVENEDHVVVGEFSLAQEWALRENARNELGRGGDGLHSDLARPSLPAAAAVAPLFDIAVQIAVARPLQRAVDSAKPGAPIYSHLAGAFWLPPPAALDGVVLYKRKALHAEHPIAPRIIGQFELLGY